VLELLLWLVLFPFESLFLFFSEASKYEAAAKALPLGWRVASEFMM